MLELSANPLLHRPPASVLTIETELNGLPHLATDQRHVTQRTRRDFRDARKIKDAADAIRQLPKSDEAIHLAVSGRFALWHVVPAALKLSGQSIDALTIATLGFSKK